MKALIDADSIIFRNGFAVEHTLYRLYDPEMRDMGPVLEWDRKREIPKEYLDKIEISTSIEPVENCLHLVKQDMESIIRESGATEYKVYIKGKGNFRDAIAVTKPYKGNRDASHRPKYEPEIREYLKKYWGAVEVDGMEVDDRVAIEQVHLLNVPLNYVHDAAYASSIICTMDKDLNGVPGWHYNFHKKEKYWVTEEEAIRFFYTQLLTGDASDNVQGVPGIGIKTAEKLLKDCKTEREMYEVCFRQYVIAYGADDNNTDQAYDTLMEMANLLWIRRTENDKWQPPT